MNINKLMVLGIVIFIVLGVVWISLGIIVVLVVVVVVIGVEVYFLKNSLLNIMVLLLVVVLKGMFFFFVIDNLVYEQIILICFEVLIDCIDNLNNILFMYNDVVDILSSSFVGLWGLVD